jgi:hypothetical protein
MLEKIKAIQGINHNDFDTTINMWISAGKQELINIGIDSSKVESGTDDLINSTIICFVLSQLDVNNSELYSNSYALMKDTLRHVEGYIEDGI